MSCPSPDAIEAFLRGALGGDERAAFEQHLDACPECQRLVAQLARTWYTTAGADADLDDELDAEGSGDDGDRVTPRAGAGSDGATAPVRGGALSPGDVLGDRFRIRRFLGSGGMGVVYEADDLELGQGVAVKMLAPRWTAVPSLMRRLQREIVLARRVTHPNVCRIHDLGRTGDRRFVTMELVRGRTLDAVVRAGGFGLADALDWVRQMFDALDAIHASGVVHRDLKPTNVMLTAEGRVVVMDFGLAGDVEGGASGVLVGTPAYWAPEQAAGQTPTARSDIYAAGRVARELVERAAGGPVPKLAPVLERCLAEAPEDRFASALEARDAFVAATTPSVIVAAAESATPDESSPLLAPFRPDEERVVAVLLAIGVRDVAAFDEAVRAAGGIALDGAIGERIAVFGSGSWEGDEVARAVGAALRCRHLAAEVGVASGRAALGEGRVSGPAVAAARRASARGSLGVVVDAGSSHGLDSKFLVRAADEGMREVLGERPPTLIPAAPDETPLVGRDLQLAQLGLALDWVLAERAPHVVLVTGPTGIGKTRLRRALEAKIAGTREAVTMLDASAEPLDRLSALAPFAAALRSEARRAQLGAIAPRIDADAPAAERALAVMQLVERYVRDRAAARELVPFLGELLGVPMPPTPALETARRDPQLMADRVRLALVEWLGGALSTAPVVLIAEDLQWMDRASIALLEELPGRFVASPLLVLASARSEWLETRGEAFASALEANAARTILPLGPLTPPQCARIAEALSEGAVPPPLRDAIVARSEGNPRFLEEMVLAVRESGSWPAESGGPAQLPLPGNVEAAVQARLDRLPPDAREACKWIAVLDRATTADELASLGVPDAAQHLALLRRRGILAADEAKDVARAPHRFRSALGAEVAYRSMTAEARAERHRRIAALLARRPGTPADEIALHHERGGDRSEAAGAWARAARSAARRGDSPSVVRATERALALGPEDDDVHELEMLRADALRFLGERAEQAAALARAANAAKDDRQRAAADVERSAWLARTGRLDEALDAALAAVAAADRAGERELLALAHVREAEALTLLGRHDDAEGAIARAASIDDATSPLVAIKRVAARALLASARGDIGAARDAYLEATELCGRVGDLRRAAANAQNLADAYNRVGAYEDAEEALRRALEDCRRVSNRLAEGFALANLAHAQTMGGSPADALGSLDAAESCERLTGDARLGVFIALYRARALLAIDRAGGAVAAARAAFSKAEAAGQHGLAALAAAAESRALLANHDTAGALARARDAAGRCAERGGVEEDEAAIHVALATALEAAGLAGEAEQAREHGRERVRATAARIRDLAWRERFLRDVPDHRALLG